MAQLDSHSDRYASDDWQQRFIFQELRLLPRPLQGLLLLLPQLSMEPPAANGRFGEVEMLRVMPRFDTRMWVIKNEILLVRAVAGAAMKLSVRKIAPLLS